MDLDLIGRHVVVTTNRDRRGVFFGVLVENNTEKEEVVLTDARCAVYWSQATKGFIGLAADGPADGSRITEAAPTMFLNGVTSIIEATPKAVERWEAGPWS